MFSQLIQEIMVLLRQLNLREHQITIRLAINSRGLVFQRWIKRLSERPAPAGPNIFLTDKERDVLSMVLQGRSDAMIADKLHMSVHTVDSHMRNIFRKLEVNNRTMAVVKALTLGLIHL